MFQDKDLKDVDACVLSTGEVVKKVAEEVKEEKTSGCQAEESGEQKSE